MRCPFSRCFATCAAMEGQLCSVSLTSVFDLNLIDFIVCQKLILTIFGFVCSLCFGLSEDRHRRSKGVKVWSLQNTYTVICVSATSISANTWRGLHSVMALSEF